MWTETNKHCGVPELDTQHDQIETLIANIWENPNTSQLRELFLWLVHHFLFEEQFLREVLIEMEENPEKKSTQFTTSRSIQSHSVFHHCVLTQLVHLIEKPNQEGTYQDFIKGLDRNDNLDQRYFQELSENPGLLNRINTRIQIILDKTPTFPEDLPLIEICDIHQGTSSL